MADLTRAVRPDTQSLQGAIDVVQSRLSGAHGLVAEIGHRRILVRINLCRAENQPATSKRGARRKMGSDDPPATPAIRLL